MKTEIKPFWKRNKYVIQINGHTFVLGSYSRRKFIVEIAMDFHEMMKTKECKTISECKKTVEEFCRIDDPNPTWVKSKIGCGRLQIELNQIGWFRRFFALGVYHTKTHGVHLTYLLSEKSENKRFRTERSAVEYIENALAFQSTK